MSGIVDLYFRTQEDAKSDLFAAIENPTSNPKLAKAITHYARYYALPEDQRQTPEFEQRLRTCAHTGNPVPHSRFNLCFNARHMLDELKKERKFDPREYLEQQAQNSQQETQ